MLPAVKHSRSLHSIDEDFIFEIPYFLFDKNSEAQSNHSQSNSK
jgi:hypothetical protein